MSIDPALIGAVRNAMVIGGDPRVRSTRRQVLRSVAVHAPEAGPQRFAELVRNCCAEVDGAGPLEALLGDPMVTEIMYIGGGRTFVERAGRIQPATVVLDDDAVVQIVQRMVAPLGVRFDRAAPVVDARCPDGSRVHAVLPPLAVDGPCLTIRRFSQQPRSIAEFGVPSELSELLELRVRTGWNLIISGGTSSGKTSLLGALAQFLPADARVVTVEDTAELQLGRAHIVRLEARPANSEGVGAVTIRELVRAALRMRPDRIIVGEVRGAEAFDMLQACNTGHDGSCSSVHANSPRAALLRLAALASLGAPSLSGDAVQSHIALGIDAVVHVERDVDGCRRILAIADIEETSDGCHARVIARQTAAGLALVDSPRARPARFDA